MREHQHDRARSDGSVSPLAARGVYLRPS